MSAVVADITSDLSDDEIAQRLALVRRKRESPEPDANASGRLTSPPSTPIGVADEGGQDVRKQLSVDELRSNVVPPNGPATRSGSGHVTPRYFAPLSDAADEYVRWAKARDERVYLGIPEFDNAMRGIAPGQMSMVVAFATQGKTLLATHVIANNPNKRIIMMTPDETRTLVLIKLVALVHSVSAGHLEERIYRDDRAAIELVRSTAIDHFPNLAVFDQSLDTRQMDTAMNEAEDHWGAGTELLIFDYLDLLPTSSGEDVPSKATALKAFGKERNVPMMVLHQSSRSKGADGAEPSLTSGAYGGEQQATHLIGVRRKRSELLARIRDLRERIITSTRDTEHLQFKLDEAEYDLRLHENTITFSLLKCKTPPGRLVDELDFILDAETGALRPFTVQEATQPSVLAQRRLVMQATDPDEEPF